MEKDIGEACVTNFECAPRKYSAASEVVFTPQCDFYTHFAFSRATYERSGNI